MDKKRNDHITHPKSTLKSFWDEKTKMFSYLDLVDLGICDKTPKSYHTKLNYYPDAFDNEVNHTLETFIGNVRKGIDDVAAGCNQTPMIGGIKSKTLAFVALQTIRLPDFLQSVTDNFNPIARLNSTVAKHAKAGGLTVDIATWASLKRAEILSLMSGENTAKDLLYTSISFEYNARLVLEGFGINSADFTCMGSTIPPKINSTFCLTPQHCFQHQNCIFVVLSPRHSILLMPKDGEFCIKYRIDSTRAFIVAPMKNENDVLDFLPSVIKMTKASRRQHIIGEKHMLEKCKEVIQCELTSIS